MIIIEKWSDLPASYDILFPISSKIDINWFWNIIDARRSGDVVDDIVDCNDAADIIDCGLSNTTYNELHTALFVLVNSSNYHTYEYEVSPFKSNLIYTEFIWELPREIECGDYQAFLMLDDNSISTVRFRIEKPKQEYNEYNPNRDITIYEQGN